MNSIDQIINDVEAMTRSLSRIRSRQIRTSSRTSAVRSFVRSYFNDFRPILLSASVAEEDFGDLDVNMQNLLRCTHKQTLKTRYLSCLGNIKQTLHDLEVNTLIPVGYKKNVATDDLKCQAILETLEKVCPVAAISFEQGLTDLRETDRKSWRGTSVEFREALRELLDVMAPDKNLISQADFKVEGDTKKPTMRQMVVFILKSRRLSRSQQKAPLEAVEVVEIQVGKFVRSVYERSSAATHTQITKDEVIKVRDYITLALVELLEISV